MNSEGILEEFLHIIQEFLKQFIQAFQDKSLRISGEPCAIFEGTHKKFLNLYQKKSQYHCSILRKNSWRFFWKNLQRNPCRNLLEKLLKVMEFFNSHRNLCRNFLTLLSRRAHIDPGNVPEHNQRVQGQWGGDNIRLRGSVEKFPKKSPTKATFDKRIPSRNSGKKILKELKKTGEIAEAMHPIFPEKIFVYSI